MPVASNSAASAIARPRTPTSRMPSSAVMTPAMTSAAISPTEWPATPAGPAWARPAASE